MTPRQFVKSQGDPSSHAQMPSNAASEPAAQHVLAPAASHTLRYMLLAAREWMLANWPPVEEQFPLAYSHVVLGVTATHAAGVTAVFSE